LAADHLLALPGQPSGLPTRPLAAGGLPADGEDAQLSTGQDERLLQRAGAEVPRHH